MLKQLVIVHLSIVKFIFIFPEIFALDDSECQLKNLDVTLDIIELRHNYSINNIVKNAGYLLDTYEIVTPKDGYILTIHRIRVKFNETIRYKKPPVFVMHGLLQSSSIFVSNAENSLGFQLVEQGYDVWLGNARGTTHSRRNIRYDPDEERKQFWDFSWHEIGTIDLPSMIDFVLESTNETQLHYIGYSQGATSFFVMTSLLPEYNKKIKLMSGLGAAVYFQYTENIMLDEAAYTMLKGYKLFTRTFGHNELFSDSDALNTLAYEVCKFEAPLHEICAIDLFLLFGWDSAELNRKQLPVILANSHAGSSSKQLLHYGQLRLAANKYKTGIFQQYDYGKVRNFVKYGRFIPPDYPLKNTNARVALYTGTNDNLADYRDIAELAKVLPNVVHFYQVPYRQFNHLDFVVAKNVVKLLYDEVFRIMKMY